MLELREDGFFKSGPAGVETLEGTVGIVDFGSDDNGGNGDPKVRIDSGGVEQTAGEATGRRWRLEGSKQTSR